MRRTLSVIAVLVVLAVAANPFRPSGRGFFTPQSAPEDYLAGFWDIAPFDPASSPPPVSSRLRLDSYPGDGTGWYLVQFARPVEQWQLRQIGRSGGYLLGFHSARLAFVKMNAAAAAKVAGLSFVRWVGIYQPGYKFWSQTLADEGYGRVSVVLFYPEDLAVAVSDLTALGCQVVRTGESAVMKVVEVDCDRMQLEEIARLPYVMTIEEWHPAEPENENAQWVVQTWAQNQRRVWDQGVTGSGEILGYTDGQIDPNHYAFRDQGVAITDTGEFPTHRKIAALKKYPPARLGNPDSHGTHVGGTIAGNDSVNGGTSPNDGHSKDARLVQLSPIPQPPGNDFTEPLNIITNYLRNPELRPRTISNSWWTGTMGQYTTAAATFDMFSWKNKDVQTVKSCGNQGQSSQYRITEPGNSKSIISVGALLNGLNATQLASFSSRGPAPDGRIKPDVCAPGQGIYSAQAGTNNDYISMDGTSMAAPCVNGGIGQIRAYLRKGYYPSGTPTPADTWGYVSAALLKAMVLVSADPNIGSYVIPSEYVGWGRMDLDSVLYFPDDTRRLLVDDDTTGLATGEYREYTFQVTDSIPLRIGVVWTDTAAAAGANPALINNLDCRLLSPAGDSFRGSVWSGGQSVRNPIQPYNNRDPLEMFRVNRPEPGQWTLRVSAQNVVTRRQPFAVVLTGALGVAERHDVGVVAILAPVDTVDSGVVIVPQAVIQNYGNVVEEFPVWMGIGAGYLDSVMVSLGAGAGDTVEFAEWQAESVGTFNVVCFSALVGDEEPANDTAVTEVVVIPYTGIAGTGTVPKEFVLRSVQPTPFGHSVTISYALPQTCRVRIAIYDAAGALVRELTDSELAAGEYRLRWDGCDGTGRRVGPGVYYCRMGAASFRQIRKLVKLD